MFKASQIDNFLFKVIPSMSFVDKTAVDKCYSLHFI